MPEPGISRAGEFQLDVAEIITSSGQPFPITGNIITITFYENIKRGAITGELVLYNSFALSNIGPLIGQEYLKLKIRTPTIKAENHVIDFTENVLHIYRIGSKIHTGQATETLTLYFTTSEFMRSNRTRITRTLKGTYSSIVENILVNDLDCRKNPHIEPTSGDKKIIAPNMKPFDIIKMAKNEATTKKDNSPTFLFYETMDGKFHFRSLNSLYVQDSAWHYAKSIGGSKVLKGGLIDIERDLQTILTYNISHNDMMKNSVTGVLGSKLIVHDIFNKSYSTHNYNYLENFKNETHIDGGYALYSESPIDKNEKKISDFDDRIFLQPTTIKDTDKFTDSSHITSSGNYAYAAKNPHKWLQRRNSQILQIEDGIAININVHGHTMINVGDIVTLEIPYQSEEETKRKRKSDRFLQGKFLVKMVRHDFRIAGFVHSMALTCVKDSVPDELEINPAASEPKPASAAVVVNTVDEFYGSEFFG